MVSKAWSSFSSLSPNSSLDASQFVNHLKNKNDIRQQIALPPYNAVDWLSRRTADSADRVRFRRRLGVAVITFGFPLSKLALGTPIRQPSTLAV